MVAIEVHLIDFHFRNACTQRAWLQPASQPEAVSSRLPLTAAAHSIALVNCARRLSFSPIIKLVIWKERESLLYYSLIFFLLRVSY
jgi:hypothetical protein